MAAFNPLGLGVMPGASVQVQNLSNLIGNVPENYSFNDTTKVFSHWGISDADKAQKNLYYLKAHKAPGVSQRTHRGSQNVWYGSKSKKNSAKSEADRLADAAKKRDGPTVVYLPEIPVSIVLQALSDPVPRTGGGNWTGSHGFADWNLWVEKANRGDKFPVRLAVPREDLFEILKIHNIIPNRAWLTDNAGDHGLIASVLPVEVTNNQDLATFQSDYNQFWRSLVDYVITQFAYTKDDVSNTPENSLIQVGPDGRYILPPVEQRNNKFWRFYSEIAEDHARKEEASRDGARVARELLDDFMKFATKPRLHNVNASLKGRLVAEGGTTVGNVNDNISKVVLDIASIAGTPGNYYLQRRDDHRYSYVNINKYHDQRSAKASIGQYGKPVKGKGASRSSSSKTAEVPEFVGKIIYTDASHPNGIETSVRFPTGFIRVSPLHKGKEGTASAAKSFGGHEALRNALTALKVDKDVADRIVKSVASVLATIAMEAAQKTKRSHGRVIVYERSGETPATAAPFVPGFTVPSFGGAFGQQPASSSQSSIFGQ